MNKGDKVLIINATYGWGELSVGDVGEILNYEISSNNKFRYVVYNSKHIHWYADKNDLIKLTYDL